MKQFDDALDGTPDQRAQAMWTLLETELAAHPEVATSVARATFPAELDTVRQESFQALAQEWTNNSRQRRARRWSELQARLSALPVEPLADEETLSTYLGAPQPESRFFEPLRGLLREAASAQSEILERVQEAIGRAALEISQIVTPKLALASASSGVDLEWSAIIEDEKPEGASSEDTPPQATLSGTLTIEKSGQVVVDALILQPRRDWAGWRASLWVESEGEGWLPVGSIGIQPNGSLDDAITPEGLTLSQALEPRLKLLLFRPLP